MEVAGFSSTDVQFDLLDGPGSAGAAAVTVVSGGGGHGVHEPQPSKPGADNVSQGASSYENSCVVQEENETKSSVKMSPGVMSQSTSLSSWQQSDLSFEGVRREMMPRVSSGANTGMVDPAVREEDIRNMVEILLSPRNRNALLIGDTAVGANSVVEDLASRLKTGLVPKQLAGVQFLDPKLSLSSFRHCSSLQMEQSLAELSKIVEECMPDGAILHIGDLQWLTEPINSVAELQWLTAAELGNLLARHANNRLWFVGVVTPYTFARLQVLHPSLASEWKLQSLQVTTAFQPPQTAFLQGFSSNLSDQQALNFLPVRGSSPKVVSVPVMQSSRYPGNTQVTQMNQCCADCLSKFDEERRQLSLSLQLAPNKWLSSNDEVTSGGPNEAMSQTKSPSVVHQLVQLSLKWPKFCRMHHGEASPVQQHFPSPPTWFPASSHSRSCDLRLDLVSSQWSNPLERHLGSSVVDQPLRTPLSIPLYMQAARDQSCGSPLSQRASEVVAPTKPSEAPVFTSPKDGSSVPSAPEDHEDPNLSTGTSAHDAAPPIQTNLALGRANVPGKLRAQLQSQLSPLQSQPSSGTPAWLMQSPLRRRSLGGAPTQEAPWSASPLASRQARVTKWPSPSLPMSTPSDLDMHQDEEGLTAPQVHMQRITGLEDFHESDKEGTTSGDDHDVDVAPISPPDPGESFPGPSRFHKKRAAVLHHGRAREPRFSITTRTDLKVLDDGYKWLKYGQKPVKNSPHPRDYYRCFAANCPVRKRTERSTKDSGLMICTYEGTHTHPSPMALDSSYSSMSFNHFPQAGGTGIKLEDSHIQGRSRMCTKSIQDESDLDDRLSSIARPSEFNPGIDMFLETCMLSRIIIGDDQEAATSGDDDRDVDVATTRSLQRKRRGLYARRPCMYTTTKVNASDDGYQWRKVGQKAVENSCYPRDYYRCTTANCPARKRTERSADDPGLLLVRYEGTHTHPSPMELDSSHDFKSFNHCPQAGGTGWTPRDLDLHQDKEGFTAPKVHMHLPNKEELALSKAKGQSTMVENPISFKEDINDISIDGIMCNDEFISLVKKRREAMTFIQTVDIQEAFSKADPFDQSTIVLGLFNVTSNNLEFYFESGENMAKLVGVGLHHASVIVKHGIIFEVQEIEREKWEKLWHEVKEGSTKECKIMKVRLPQISGILGEGRDVATSSASINHIFQDHTSMASNYALQVPYLWEISKFFIMERVIDVFHTNRDNIMWNESIEAQCMDNYPNDGNEANMTWYQNLKVLFSRGISYQNGNNQRQEEMGQGEGYGNGDGDGDSSRVFSNTDHVQDEETFTQVNVILLSGGDFFEKNMEPLSDRYPISIERLENVKVTPELTFGFRKSRDSKKIRISTSVVFALDLDCDSIESCPHSINHGHESCGHFGWFHDELYESLGPIDQHIQRTAYLKHDFKEEDCVAGKTTNKSSTSKDITKGNERSYHTTLVVGSSQGARLALGANMKQQASCMDHESNEQSIESSCNLTEGGFKIQAKHMMHLELLQYKYLAPYIDIIAEQVQDRKYRYDLINHPVCTLQKTQFSGTWLPTGNDDVATYAFKAKRKLHEIRIEEETFLTSGSSGFKTLFKKRNRDHLEVHIRSHLEPPLTQAYEKQLYVNHALSHLVDGQTYTLIESSQPQNPLGNVDAALVRFPILVDYQ